MLAVAVNWPPERLIVPVEVLAMTALAAVPETPVPKSTVRPPSTIAVPLVVGTAPPDGPGDDVATCRADQGPDREHSKDGNGGPASGGPPSIQTVHDVAFRWKAFLPTRPTDARHDQFPSLGAHHHCMEKQEGTPA
jgi:hypothetical protein